LTPTPDIRAASCRIVCLYFNSRAISISHQICNALVIHPLWALVGTAVLGCLVLHILRKRKNAPQRTGVRHSRCFSAVDRAPATMSAAASRVIGQKFTDFLVVRRTEGSKLPALVLRAHTPGAGYSLDTRGYQPAGYRLLRARGTLGNGVTNLSFSQQLLGNLHRRDSAASSFYWSDRREFCSLAFAPRRAEYSGLEPQNHFTRARTIHQSDFRDSRKPALRAV